MIKLNDIIDANNLLMSLGGEDQLPKLAATAIERSLELQHRIDRALDYAKHAPPNSTHARQMARILDGSITVDDEAQEIPEQHPLPSRQPRQIKAVPAKGPGSRQSGLASRSRPERQAFRQWAEEQGYNVPKAGAVPQSLVDEYDEAMKNRPAPTNRMMFQ